MNALRLAMALFLLGVLVALCHPVERVEAEPRDTPTPVVGTCPPLPGWECFTKGELWSGVLLYRADAQAATASLAACRRDLAARTSTVIEAFIPTPIPVVTEPDSEESIMTKVLAALGVFGVGILVGTLID